MNNLITDTFGSGLTEFAQVLEAVAALAIFPAYCLLLFAIGAYLFFRSRRLRIEHHHNVDLLLNEFPRLMNVYADADEAEPSPTREVADPREEKFEEAEDSDIEQVAKKDEKTGTAQAPVTGKRGLSRDRSREGVWRVTVHDAPLLVLSATIVSGLYLVLTLAAPGFGGDPLTQLIRRLPLGEEWALVRHLALGPNSFFLPLVLYTIIGGILLAILPGRLVHLLNMEWLHVEPFSRRSRLTRRIWRNLCFVNTHKLDGSVGKWLVLLIPFYLVTLFLADLFALYYGFLLPPALLAAAHLLPVALPRMFAPVWDSAIDFVRPPGSSLRRLAVEELPGHMSRKEYLGDLTNKAVVDLRETIVLPAANPITFHEGNLPKRLKYSLDQLGREDLEPFMAHAVDQLLGKRTSLVVSGPKGSGRRTLAKLAAIEAAFRGHSTLFLVRDRQEALTLVEEFQEMAHGFPAVSFFKITHAASNLLYEIKGFADEVDILVADVGSFDRAADHQDYLRLFWDRLDLAVILDADEVSPLIKMELPLLTKRITSLAGCGIRELPIMITVLDGAREDQKSFARLLCRRYVELPMGHAGEARIDFLTLSVKGRGNVTFESDLDLFARFGSGLADAGYGRYFLNVRPHMQGSLARLDQARWTTRAEDFAEEPAVVSLVRLQPETFFNQLSEIRELSRACPTGHHICFLLPASDGFEQWLHDHLGQIVKHRHDHLAPVLVPGTNNSILARKHILRAIQEGIRTPDDLAESFGRENVTRLINEVDGTPAGEKPPACRETHALYGEVLRLNPDMARPGDSTRKPIFGAVAGPSAKESPVRVVCGELGLERFIDPDRQGSILWPDRVFTLQGERVRVQGRARDGVLTCVPETEDVRTLKIRQLFVTENRDISLASDHVFASEGIGIYRARLKVMEAILGYRTWKGHDLLRETTYGVDEQIINRFEAESAVLFLPGLDPEAAHLVAHLVKRYLKIVCGDTEDAIDVAHGCFEPFSKGVADNVYFDVTVIDNVPGGLGVCDLVTPELVRKIAAQTVTMHDAGAEWYDIHDCHYPRLVRFDQVHPDGSAASDLSTAERVVAYFRKVILAAEADEGHEPLDYSCNLWIPDGKSEPLYDEEPLDRTAFERPGLFAESAPLREMMSRVYADTNRIGRPALDLAGDEPE